MTLTKKNKYKKQNKTHKNKCKMSFNTYNTFEDKFEKIYGDIFSSKDFNLEKTIIKDLKQAVSPSNINPRNDYYSYINERWLNKEQLEKGQEYIVQVDSFRLVQDKVYRELIQIIDKYIKNSNTKLSKEINNFYKSQLKLNTDIQTKNYANKTLESIDEIRKNGNLWKLLGLSNSNEIVSWGSPFTWSLNPDDKNPSIFRCYIDQPQLSLIDINIYFDDGIDVEYKRKYKIQFFKYINELFDNKNPFIDIDDIYNFIANLNNFCIKVLENISDKYINLKHFDSLTSSTISKN